MPVKVKFPDGEREVPSHRVELKSKQIGEGKSVFYDAPDDDPDWRFQQVIGGWIAMATRKQPN